MDSSVHRHRCKTQIKNDLPQLPAQAHRFRHCSHQPRPVRITVRRLERCTRLGGPVACYSTRVMVTNTLFDSHPLRSVVLQQFPSGVGGPVACYSMRSMVVDTLLGAHPLGEVVPKPAPRMRISCVVAA